MKRYLEMIVNKEPLTAEQIKHATDLMLVEEVTDSEIAAFLFGLRLKGETVAEIVGIVESIQEHAATFMEIPAGTMDNCGTGGDGSSSFNISTTSAFVLAGAGIPMAKHGNRSISSRTGSGDVLEKLGVHISLPMKAAVELLHEIGITFLFAPEVHQTMKRVMNVRQSLKVPTIFNLIGPLTNPIPLQYQLVGMYRRDLLPMFAKVLRQLGRKRAVLVNGAGYMDEASLQGENHLVILENNEITKRLLHPEEVGLPVHSNEDIRGGDAEDNSAILQSVLRGIKGPYYDTVLLNAGVGIFAAGKADSILDGIEIAKESIASGRAYEKLRLLVEYSQAYRLGVH